MKIFLILINIVYFQILNSQSIEVLNGQEYYYSKVETGGPNISNKYLNNGTPIFKFRFSYAVNHNITLYSQFYSAKSFAHIEIRTREEDMKWIEGIRPGIGGANSRTRVFRLGLGTAYNAKLMKIFTISPKFILNLEQAKETYSSGLRSKGDVNGRYNYDTYAGSIPGKQILPEIGISIKVKCIWGISLFSEYSYLQGHRPNQYIEAIFSIDGIEQLKARNINDGTAHHLTVGVAYNFKTE
jgi:hypothetical protein